MNMVYEMLVYDQQGRYIGLIHFKSKSEAMQFHKNPVYSYTDRGMVTADPMTFQEVQEVGHCAMTLLI